MHDELTYATTDAPPTAPAIDLLNPERRTPLLLLLDTSGSVDGPPLDQLNAALPVLENELRSEALARHRVEVGIVKFGDDKTTVVQDFTTVTGFRAPTLTAGGNTPLGQAIHVGLDLVDQRKQFYKQNGVEYVRPWYFIITDARGTDDTQSAIERLRREDADKRVMVFAVGFGDVDMTALAQLTPQSRPPLRLDGLKFPELFKWLGVSMRRVSTSKTGAQITLPPTDTWATTTV